MASKKEQTPIRPDSHIELRETIVHREPGRAPMLGCLESRRFLEVEEGVIVAIEAINRHRSLADAGREVEKLLGEPIDLVSLVKMLRDRDFVAAIDGAPTDPIERASTRHPRLHSIRAEQLGWIRSKPLLVTIGALISAWFVALVLDPTLIPRGRDILVWGRPSLVMLASLLGLLVIGYLHELAHFFVARSFGVESTIHLSHRYYLLVLQTDVTNAWVLSDARKLAVFLAGVTLNATLAAVAGLSIIAIQIGLIPVSEGWIPYLRFFGFLNIFPIIFQIFIFARTDLYYVLAVLLRERNLRGDSLSALGLYLQNAWLRLRGRALTTCESCRESVRAGATRCLRCGHPQRDAEGTTVPTKFRWESRRRLLAFGVFFVLGSIAGYAWFLRVFVRIYLRFVAVAWQHFLDAISIPSFWLIFEAEWLLIIAVLQVGAVVYFLARGLRVPLAISWLARRYASMREKKTARAGKLEAGTEEALR